MSDYRADSAPENAPPCRSCVALRARIAEMEAALAPFVALVGEGIRADWPDNLGVRVSIELKPKVGYGRAQLTLGDLRRARALLGKGE